MAARLGLPPRFEKASDCNFSSLCELAHKPRSTQNPRLEESPVHALRASDFTQPAPKVVAYIRSELCFNARKPVGNGVSGRC